MRPALRDGGEGAEEEMSDISNQLSIDESDPVTKIHGYVFVLTPIDLLCSEGVEIIPGHRIVRANEKQVKGIKEALRQFRNGPVIEISPYENNAHTSPDRTRRHFEKLPQESWRYWIIEFDGTNSELQELQFACALVPNDIELGFWFISHEPFIGSGLGWDPSSIHTFLHSHITGFMEAKQIDKSDLDQIRRNYEEIKKLSPDYVHIRRALLRYDQLRWLPRGSEMVVIGLFSIIESLISHAPKLTDSADSLSHQLRTKLPLLRKRFVDSLDHSSQFPGIKEENLWKKLYAYRSKIVHGEGSQMSGDLTSLGNVASVITFLRETSKRLLQLSLREPQFMTDLKKC